MYFSNEKWTCQGCPTAISNMVENGDWLVLVSLTRWRTNSKIISVPNRPVCCLASPANFTYGRVEAKVLSHVTSMPVLLRPVNNFLGEVMGNASEGKYNTMNNSPSGEVTFKKCLKSGITLFSSKNSS